jgi:hypothetical protein
MLYSLLDEVFTTGLSIHYWIEKNVESNFQETLLEKPKSLGLDVRQELLKFHDKWYSSNMMSLAVVGNQTIDELEKMVVELFSGMQLHTLGLILVWS